MTAAVAAWLLNMAILGALAWTAYHMARGLRTVRTTRAHKQPTHVRICTSPYDWQSSGDFL